MRKSRWVSWLCLGLFTVQTVTAPLLQAEGWVIVTRETSVQKLAKKIDKLERHVDQYGSVVSKVPDVWGEERLTIHREEYEREMFKTLEQFKGTINAQQRRADNAFLASTLSVMAAVGKDASTSTRPTSNSALGLIVSNELTPDPKKDDDAEEKATAQEVKFGEFSADVLNRTAVNQLATPELKGQVALEPTEFLDQMSRYINHLHELRRINAGDDTRTLPGYSLNLLRVPVSVMPGNKTREGYGAEITFTVSPQIGPELLKTTFRTMVLSDIEYQLAMPLTSALNTLNDFDTLNYVQPALSQILASKSQSPIETIALQNLVKKFIDDTKTGQWSVWTALDTFSRSLDSRRNYHWGDSSWWVEFTKEGDPVDVEVTALWDDFGMRLLNLIGLSAVDKDQLSRWKNTLSDSALFDTKSAVGILKFQGDVWGTAESFAFDLGRNSSRNSQLAFPLSQFSTVYGQHALLRAVLDAHFRVHNEPLSANLNPDKNRAYVQYQDVLSYLKEELAGAYEILEPAENAHLWRHCSRELVLAIRNRDRSSANTLRCAFFNDLEALAVSADGVRADKSITGVYAWAILVEAALLNERLISDMREVASSHACPCVCGDGMVFFGPNPSPGAAEAFNQYVRCRWPIHVFHVDPVNQEQNVGDRFSARRELQLALAVAVATGTVSADSATRYARRLEMDLDSISLNRTVVGFSHGEDTFGFRFQPRTQAPDTPRMGQAVHQFFHGISRDSVLDDQRIEPGQRECLALVVAPSFLRQLIVDVHSDWYPLTQPKKTRLTTSQAVDLSADIKEMQLVAEACVADEGRYRDGEVYRLLRRVDQLSKELPMQTLRVELPVARPLGGFRLLSPGGNFDRSPQLYAYYGEPGVSRNSKTTLFLLGENFRLQGMYVVAGGKRIEDTTSPDETNLRMISDTVLQVTIPEGVNVTEEAGRQFVDVHVATYNGPSQHVRIPVIEDDDVQKLYVNESAGAAATVGSVIAPAAGTMSFELKKSSSPGAFLVNPASGAITVASTAQLNYETTPVVELEVRITTTTSPATSWNRTIRIYVVDTNEAPRAPTQSLFVQENSTNGTRVGRFRVNDADLGQTVRFSIKNEHPAGALSIHPVTGQIKVANRQLLDYERFPSLTLTVVATDSGNPALSSSTPVVVNLADVNERPQVAGQTLTIRDDVKSGALIGDVIASDPDAGQTLTYTLSDSTLKDVFAVHPTTGAITITDPRPLDARTTPTVTLTVAATDSSTPPLHSHATISIQVVGAVAQNTDQGNVPGDQEPAISWSSPSLSVELLVDEDRKVVGIRQLDDIQIIMDPNLAAAGSSAKFRGWVFAKELGSQVNTKPEFGSATSIAELRFRDGVSELPGDVSRNRTAGSFVETLEELLKGYEVPEQLESLEVMGFVKLPATGRETEAPPAIKMPQRLTLQVVIRHNSDAGPVVVPASAEIEAKAPSKRRTVPHNR